MNSLLSSSYSNVESKHSSSSNSYNEAIKIANEKCRSLEREVNILRSQIQSAKNNEGWCQRAGGQTLQELNRLRVQVPEIEKERDQLLEENNHLYSAIDQLGFRIEKEMAERDHWKQNIEEMKHDIAMLERKKVEDLASIELERFSQLQMKNMAEQYVINNNIVDLENKKNEVENKKRLNEKSAAIQNIQYFEKEKFSLQHHVETQIEEINTLKIEVEELGKENDELNRQLDHKKDGDDFDSFSLFSAFRKNPLRFSLPPLQNLGRGISARSFGGGGSVASGIRGTWSIKSAPHIASMTVGGSSTSETLVENYETDDNSL